MADKMKSDWPPSSSPVHQQPLCGKNVSGHGVRRCEVPAQQSGPRSLVDAVKGNVAGSGAAMWALFQRIENKAGANDIAVRLARRPGVNDETLLAVRDIYKFPADEAVRVAKNCVRLDDHSIVLLLRKARSGPWTEKLDSGADRVICDLVKSAKLRVACFVLRECYTPEEQGRVAMSPMVRSCVDASDNLFCKLATLNELPATSHPTEDTEKKKEDILKTLPETQLEGRRGWYRKVHGTWQLAEHPKVFEAKESFMQKVVAWNADRVEQTDLMKHIAYVASVVDAEGGTAMEVARLLSLRADLEPIKEVVVRSKGGKEISSAILFLIGVLASRDPESLPQTIPVQIREESCILSVEPSAATRRGLASVAELVITKSKAIVPRAVELAKQGYVDVARAMLKGLDSSHINGFLRLLVKDNPKCAVYVVAALPNEDWKLKLGDNDQKLLARMAARDRTGRSNPEINAALERYEQQKKHAFGLYTI